MKQLFSGNEALARGAFEAGVKIASAFPGTPSTEILENIAKYKDHIYAEWAPNEKVATEMAYGASIAGVRSLCAMKNAGVNVAADPIFTAAYHGVGRGFIIISADDPSMHSSQNEQDNRHYAKAAKLALVEPSDSQECIDFLKAAYEISEQFDIPVMLRTTTRVSHSKSLVEFGDPLTIEPKEYERNISRNVCAPGNAYHHHPQLEEKLERLADFSNNCPLNTVEMNDSKIGVISASAAYLYAKEAFPENTSFLKIGLSNPMPMDLIKDFASKVDKLYIIEELDPFMEEQIKAAGINCIGKELTGKLYELNAELLRERIFGVKPETKELSVEAVSRPPALCPGCPHRGFFYTMTKNKNFVISGDIGCYTLGASSPLNAMDTCVCMGGGFSIGMGMAKAFQLTGKTQKKVFGVVGDSTFFHSGMTGAVEILYNNGNMIPVVLDNSITAMTGHQENPNSSMTLSGETTHQIKIEEILSSYGYENIIIVDPQDLTAMQKAVDDALASEVPAAIITRRPCLLIKKIKHDTSLCEVDRNTCIGCKMCLKVGCPAIHMNDSKAEIDQTQCVGCTVCAQVCPKKAISRKDK